MILIDTLSSAPPARPILIGKFHPERRVTANLAAYLRLTTSITIASHDLHSKVSTS